MTDEEGTSALMPTGLLLVAAVAGFVISNSSLSVSYLNFLNTGFLLKVGNYEVLSKSVLLLINDGLMAVFFLFVGLELKRELLVGELSNFRKASLPIVAALGGMCVPALIYFLLNQSGDARNGWGIPMATDIAFALGILTVLGSRVPKSLKIMLAAVAIVDDLGAILVIAMFYTSEIGIGYLALAMGSFLVCLLLNRAGIVKISVYMMIGLPMWYFMLKSGVHATISGVMLAFAIPLSSKGACRATVISDIFNKKASPLDSPAVFLEKSLVKWVSLLIIPIFAFANSGVSIGTITIGSVSMGVILGLVLGKPIGVVGFSWVASKIGLAHLPKGMTWRHLIGLGCIAGIGFTMSLFIGSLAFSMPESFEEAKLAILMGSVISAFFGVFVLLSSKNEKKTLVE